MKSLTPRTNREGVPYALSAVPSYADPTNRSGRFDFSRSVYNWKSTNTRRLRASVARAGTGGRGVHAVLGDSLSMGAISDTIFDRLNAWPLQYRSIMNGTCALAGDGYVQASWFPTNQAAAMDPRWTVPGTWANNGSWLQSGSSGATASFASQLTGTQVDVWFYGTSAAFTVSIDGGTAVNVPRSGNLILEKYTVSGLVDTRHQVAIVATTADPVYITGISVTSSAGLIVHNMGIYGSTVNQWATADGLNQAGSQRSVLNNTVPDAVFIPLGLNDLFQGRSVAQIKADFTTLISSYLGSSDVVLLAEMLPASLSAAQVEGYALAMYELADQFDIPLVDIYSLFGPFAGANAAGLFGPDSTHLSAAGYRMWGSNFAQIVGVGSSTNLDLRSDVVYGNGKPAVGMGLEPCNILSTTNVTQTTTLLNAVRFLPIDVPPGCEWDRIQAWVSSAESGGANVVRTVGLYASVDGTLPDVNGGLLKSGVLPAFTSVNSKQFVFDVPLRLKPGRYYLATHLTYTTAPSTFPQVMSANNASRLPLWLGDQPSNANMRQSNNARVYMLSNISALPNSLANPQWFPTGDSLSMHMVLGRSA